MDVMIHCESCRAQLRVPSSAAGRKARCPQCGERFTVPAMQELLEETITGWIVQDVDEVISNRTQEKLEELRPQNEAERRAVTRKRAAAAALTRAGGSSATATAPPGRHRRPEPPPSRPAHASHETMVAEKVETPTTGYPTNLKINDPIPHLVVHKVSPGGVRFAFDSVWLEHEGFRASMPVRCVFSGNADRSRLLARAMIFTDRSTAENPSDKMITATHEVRNIGDRETRQIMAAMDTIQSMPGAFALPVPYYLHEKYAAHVLQCRTHTRSSGGITCDVLIPDAVCALEWLARVNGICGKEYELLQRDVSMLHGDAWRDLPETTRQRLAQWCRLRPHEVFEEYFPDADLARADDGLAGVVLTDKRLVFCKYHHRGQVRLDADDATILVREEAGTAHLTLVVGKDRSRMVKLRPDDVARLEELLRSSSTVEVVHTSR